MSASLAVRRMLARRPSPAPTRRYLWRRCRPNSIAEKIASLGEEERALMSNHLAELDAELQSRLVQKVDSFQSSAISDDRGILSRVPKGEQRDRLAWRSILAATFLVSAAMGQREACKCAQYHDAYQRKHEEGAASPSAANHAA